MDQVTVEKIEQMPEGYLRAHLVVTAEGTVGVGKVITDNSCGSWLVPVDAESARTASKMLELAPQWAAFLQKEIDKGKQKIEKRWPKSSPHPDNPFANN